MLSQIGKEIIESATNIKLRSSHMVPFLLPSSVEARREGGLRLLLARLEGTWGVLSKSMEMAFFPSVSTQ